MVGPCGFARGMMTRANDARLIDSWGRGFDVAERDGNPSFIKREGYDVKELRIVGANGRRTGGFHPDVFRSATRGRYVSIPRGELAMPDYPVPKDAHFRSDEADAWPRSPRSRRGEAGAAPGGVRVGSREASCWVAGE